ncbi:MAG: hypothetical protein AAB403_14790 [Planctomycetota bacterium]
MPTVFHYTDEAGLAGMTASEGKWFPSAGTAIDLNRSPFESVQSALINASKKFYSSAFETRDWHSPVSAQFHDITYGPGWYVTSLPPTTSTQQLLKELWRGNVDYLSKTRHWLEMEVDAHSLKYPDPERPTVGFITYLEKISRRSGNLVGQNPYGVLVKGCGRRIQKGLQVVTETMKIWSPPLCVVGSFIAAVDAFETLSPDAQANILGYLRLDSGFPAIADPPFLIPVELDSHQANAMVHLMIKWLGSDFKFERPRRQTYSEDKNFAVRLRATRNRGTEIQSVEVLFLSQMSPVRREIVQEFYRDIGESVGIVVTTSTYAMNVMTLAKETRFALLLATQSPGFSFHMVQLADAHISFPRCEYWIVNGNATDSHYLEVQSTEQLRKTLGLNSGL